MKLLAYLKCVSSNLINNAKQVSKWLCYLTIATAVHEVSPCTVLSEVPIIVHHYNYNSSDFEQGYCMVVLVCIPMIINEIEQVFKFFG